LAIRLVEAEKRGEKQVLDEFWKLAANIVGIDQ